MGEPLLGNRIFQRSYDVILTEDVVEGFRAVFSGEDLVAHGRDRKEDCGFVSTGFCLCGMIPDFVEKRRRYSEAKLRIGGLIDGESDEIARMSGVVAVLHEMMPHYYWTGFYRVVRDSLVVGPYQGSSACARIDWGKGICGTAWKIGEVQLVADVSACPGHIACDARSRSEIVVPVKDARGRLVAVLDVDSTELGAFDDEDREGLLAILDGLIRG